MHTEPTASVPAATPEHRRMVATEYPGIYSKGSRYLVRWRDRGRLATRSFRTLSEAKRFKKQVAAGDTRPTSRDPFKNYALKWLDAYTGRTGKGVADSTRDSYRDWIEREAMPFFGTVPLDDIDPPMLKEYHAYLAKRGLAPSSVRRAYAPVRALLATAYEDGLLKSNPAAGVRVIVAEPDNRPARRMHLTAEETKRLLAEIPDEHADLVLLLATTGARISEPLTATYGGFGQDVDGGPVLRFAKSKTEAGLQPIPLTPEAARMLVRRRDDAGASDDDLIFPNANGTPMDRRNWTRRVFKPAARRAGVPWASPHKLRHSVATLMAERGYQAADIARMLRHADGGALAQRTYMHPKVRSVDFLDDAIGGAR